MIYIRGGWGCRLPFPLFAGGKGAAEHVDCRSGGWEFSSDILRKLDRHFKGLFLFGSRARRDSRARSAYDFLFFVDESNKETVRIDRETEIELPDTEDVLSGSLILTV